MRSAVLVLSTALSLNLTPTLGTTVPHTEHIPELCVNSEVREPTESLAAARAAGAMKAGIVALYATAGPPLGRSDDVGATQ